LIKHSKCLDWQKRRNLRLSQKRHLKSKKLFVIKLWEILLKITFQLVKFKRTNSTFLRKSSLRVLSVRLQNRCVLSQFNLMASESKPLRQIWTYLGFQSQTRSPRQTYSRSLLLRKPSGTSIIWTLSSSTQNEKKKTLSKSSSKTWKKKIRRNRRIWSKRGALRSTWMPHKNRQQVRVAMKPLHPLTKHLVRRSKPQFKLMTWLVKRLCKVSALRSMNLRAPLLRAKWWARVWKIRLQFTRWARVWNKRLSSWAQACNLLHQVRLWAQVYSKYLSVKLWCSLSRVTKVQLHRSRRK